MTGVVSAHSFDADRSGGSRFQRIPGKMQDGPGRRANAICPRPNPLCFSDRKGLVVHATRLQGHLLPDGLPFSAPLGRGEAR